MHISSFLNSTTNVDDAIRRLKHLILEQYSNDITLRDPQHYVSLPRNAMEHSDVIVSTPDHERIDLARYPGRLAEFASPRTYFGKFIKKEVKTRHGVREYKFYFENIIIDIYVDIEEAGLWGERIEDISKLLN